MNTSELKTGGPCPKCNGRGVLQGQNGLHDTCLDCGGTGKVVDVDFHGVEQRSSVASWEGLKRPLNFSDLERACLSRNKEWWQGDALDTDRKLFFGVEMGEESGEVCGVIKKLHRQEHGMPTGAHKTVKDLSDELADVVITAQNIAAQFGINLGGAIRTKFNETSTKRGFTTKL